MKKIIITCLIIVQYFAIEKAHAQSAGMSDTFKKDVSSPTRIPVAKNYKFTDLNNRKFLGAWIYQSGNVTIHVDLKNISKTKLNITTEALDGELSYSMNGIDKKFKIIGSTEGSNSTAHIYVNDSENEDNSAKFLLTYMDNNTIKLSLAKWEWHKNADLGIPSTIILKREK